MSWFSSIFSPVQCEAPAESKPQETSHDEHKEEAPAPDHKEEKEGKDEEKEEGEEKEEEPEEEEPEDVSLCYERKGCSTDRRDGRVRFCRDYGTSARRARLV